MDLIYMNSKREDIGVLFGYELDLSIGDDENNFECVISEKAHCCQPGFFLYAEGTEYGGMIDAIQVDTAKGEVTYSGRTWHGILDSKIIEPDTGERHLVLSGDLHAVIKALIERIGLESLFTVDESECKISVEGYKMRRYTSAYAGIIEMLESVGAKLLFSYHDGMVVLSACRIDRYMDGADSDYLDFTAKKATNTVNHLIILGSGEMENRTVYHLYADTEGNISEEQTLFGLDEYAATYNYSGAENDEDLMDYAKQRFRELRNQDSVKADFNETDDLYSIGDGIGVFDNVTGFSMVALIAKKIVTIKNGKTTIAYETKTNIGSLISDNAFITADGYYLLDADNNYFIVQEEQ